MEPLSVFLFSPLWHGHKGSRCLPNQNYGLSVGFRPSSNVELSIRPGIGRDQNNSQWVTNVDEDGDGTNDRFIFGELISRTLDLTMRAQIGFTPTLTLQAYLQPFVAVGDYGKIKALARPDSYEFVPYDKPLGFNPDFHQRSLRGNVVLRWEYQPGSTLFVVWSQNRSASPEANHPTLDAFDSLKSSFTDDGQNVFLVKMDYWFGINPLEFEQKSVDKHSINLLNVGRGFMYPSPQWIGAGSAPPG